MALQLRQKPSTLSRSLCALRQCLSLIVVIALAIPLSAAGAQLDYIVEEFLEVADPDESLPVILRLVDREDISRFRFGPRRERRRQMARALRRKASNAQRPLKRLLRRHGIDAPKSLWSINALILDASPRLLRSLSHHRAIEYIDYDGLVSLAGGSGAPTAPVEWNLDAVRATEAWALGFDGEGVVVGVIDSGADLGHVDLAAAWRGGVNDWVDLVDGRSSPHDFRGGHGTQVTGILVGGASGGRHIGVAPNAQWISARAFDSLGFATFSDLHLAFEFMLDPDGNPLTDDAPDVVNNSWAVENASGLCFNEFDQDIDLLRAAGIPVVFAAGNTGPAPSSSVSPSNDFDTVAVGATDVASNVALGSSRGPSACGGSLFPNIVAPGVSVWTTDRKILPPGYTSVSGTSFAAPHVSGALAILLEAFPFVGVTQLENVIEMSANDLGAAGPDNDTGYGLLDIRAAIGTLVQSEGCPVVASTVDTDGDGFGDVCDSCIVQANVPQRDTDGDGFGNFCDADISNDSIVNFGDLSPFAMAFGTANPDADFNGDGIVNFGDLAIFAVSFGLPPGPSGYDY